MSAYNVMTRSRTAAFRLEEAARWARVGVLLNARAERVWQDEEERRMADEEEQGPGYFDEARLENPREPDYPDYAEMEREDAKDLRENGPYGPSTRSAMEQAGFESVLFKVAMELGYNEDYARYFSKRDTRQTLLHIFEAVDERLEDKECGFDMAAYSAAIEKRMADESLFLKEFDDRRARNAAEAAASDKLRAERTVLHQQKLAAIRAAGDAQKVQHEQGMAVLRQRIENADKRLESALKP